jgi:hypothetical protein
MIHTVEHREGSIARAIEQQTAKLPSDALLWAAGASIATSLILKLLDRHHEALFVGQWAPTILILGLYNKLVKQHGSARPMFTRIMRDWKSPIPCLTQ